MLDMDIDEIEIVDENAYVNSSYRKDSKLIG
jgi:hypothetical protein